MFCVLIIQILINLKAVQIRKFFDAKIVANTFSRFAYVWQYKQFDNII